MIDIESETIITLGDACGYFPPEGVSTATIARWIQRGVRGVTLETIAIGGRRCTSREAIERFIAAQNADDTHATPSITPAQRRRQSEAARMELACMGVSSR